MEWTSLCLWACADDNTYTQVEAQAGTGSAFHPYLLTGETRRMTRDKVAPDYAAVLLVCSRYLWVSAIQLHSEVAQLEYEMAEVETTVSASE